MDYIIDQERIKIDSLYNTLENLISVLTKNSTKLDKKSQGNLVDKLRLFNKNLGNLGDEANNILIDLKNLDCDLDNNLLNRLTEEENTNRMIMELSPLMLLYSMNRTPVNNENAVSSII